MEAEILELQGKFQIKEGAQGLLEEEALDQELEEFQIKVYLAEEQQTRDMRMEGDLDQDHKDCLKEVGMGPTTNLNPKEDLKFC